MKYTMIEAQSEQPECRMTLLQSQAAAGSKTIRVGKLEILN
jgi:hypothetical protein